MREVDGRIVWAPRVPRAEIRRLYESEAATLLDEELCDRVAWAIWERCRDILTVTRAHKGEAMCPRCQSIVRHGWKHDERMTCPCGWSMTWRAYMQTYRRKQLHGGGSVPWMEEFADALPRVKGAREQMLLIDRLINRWHWDLKHPEPNEKVAAPSRPTAINVIGGTGREIIEFLDELAGLASDDPALKANREAFETNRAASFSWWQRDRMTS
jgi:hypothetical protein